MQTSHETLLVAYQGGPGSHSERAGMHLLGTRFSGRPFASFAEASAALAGGCVDALVLPVANTTTGAIAEALAAVAGCSFVCAAELQLPIEHYLLAVPGVRRHELQEAWAHPQVALQCARWVQKSGLRAVLVDDGARRATDFLAGRLRHVGVLGPLRIGEATGLYPLEGPIQDQPGNATTFRLLARADNPNLNRLRALCAKGNQP